MPANQVRIFNTDYSRFFALGSNFRVEWREYECNPKYHDRCYIAFCEYAGNIVVQIEIP
jgi:hypothetical protein